MNEISQTCIACLSFDNILYLLKNLSFSSFPFLYKPQEEEIRIFPGLK